MKQEDQVHSTCHLEIEQTNMFDAGNIRLNLACYISFHHCAMYKTE